MKREEKQKQIEQRILKAIFEKIKEEDLESITSNEIAEAAKVSKRTLYKYFSSKTEMYLGLVKESFTEMYNNIEEAISKINDRAPISVIECIGINYLKFVINNPVKGKIITSYNENDYKKEYPVQVEEIAIIANKYELTDYVRAVFENSDVKPNVSIESTVMFLWSSIQGLGILLSSKGSWIKEFYKIEEDRLIKEVMILIKQILGKV